jgi:hypothetical protein
MNAEPAGPRQCHSGSAEADATARGSGTDKAAVALPGTAERQRLAVEAAVTGLRWRRRCGGAMHGMIFSPFLSLSLPSPQGWRTAIGEKKRSAGERGSAGRRGGRGRERGGGTRGGGGGAGGLEGGGGIRASGDFFLDNPRSAHRAPQLRRPNYGRATTKKHLRPAVKNPATNQGLGPSKAAWKSLGPTTGVWPPADLFSRATPRAPPSMPRLTQPR